MSTQADSAEDLRRLGRVLDSIPDGDIPSWSEIKKHQWSEIEANYKAGARDKETVCAWMAYKAALVVCKGWPAGSFDELLTEGYIAALHKWPDYDPRKATKNGISGFLYKQALGRMRNAASELFTPHGKRKHKATDVLPSVVVQAHEHLERSAEGSKNVTKTRDSESYYGAEYSQSSVPDKLEDSKLSGLWAPQHIIKAADRAVISKSFNFNWTSRVNAPSGASSRAVERAATEAMVFRIGELLALLPPKECDLVSRYWGVNGVQKATLTELAEYAECSPAVMYKRLQKLLVDLKTLSKVKP